jgi:hypothetical protein
MALGERFGPISLKINPRQLWIQTEPVLYLAQFEGYITVSSHWDSHCELSIRLKLSLIVLRQIKLLMHLVIDNVTQQKVFHWVDIFELARYNSLDTE